MESDFLLMLLIVLMGYWLYIPAKRVTLRVRRAPGVFDLSYSHPYRGRSLFIAICSLSARFCFSCDN
jgi:hypothetical protein